MDDKVTTTVGSNRPGPTRGVTGRPSQAESLIEHEGPRAPMAAARRVMTDRVIWFLVALGLLLRLMALALMPAHDLISDETEYLAAARILADGRGFSYYDAAPWLRAPGYPLLLAIALRIVGHLPESIQWLQIGLSLLMAPLAAWLSELHDGRPMARRVAAGLTLALLPLAVLPWLLLSETVMTVLLMLAVSGLVAHRRDGWRGWLVATGLALGGACLVRGIVVGYLALVGLLLLWPSVRTWRQRLVDMVIVVGLAAALIAPWTLRNLIAYRAFIPLETTAAYNLWLRAQGGRGESWMLDELRALPDPASRQSHAFQRGLSLIVRDPMPYLDKGWRELGDLISLNFGAAERLMTGYSGGEVNRAWLLLSFALDDGLYLLVLSLAVPGLMRADGPVRRWAVLWLLWTALTALLFFAIVRFRLPALPLLAVLAGSGWCVLRSLPNESPRRWLPPALGILLVLALVGPSFDGAAYLTGWQARGAWEQADQAEQVRRAGQPAAALAMLGDRPAAVPAATIVRGLALAQLGQIEAAEAVLAAARVEPRTQVAQGEVRRLAGDLIGARRYWNARDVDVANPVEWAWQRVGEPAARLDVGDGLDLGLVRGMHQDEREGGTGYRWTNGRGALRLSALPVGPARLVARLRGYRPPGAGPMTTLVTIDGHPLTTLTLTGDWQIIEVPLSPTERSGAIVLIELISDTFVPGYVDPRPLGLMVDWLELRSG